MKGAQDSRQIILDGRVLWNGIRQASECSDDALLGIAQAKSLTLVLFRESHLFVSWRFALSSPLVEPVAFGIPAMMVGHLIGCAPPASDAVRLAVSGSEVSLSTNDAVGPFELRWRFDVNKFPAPPDLNRFLEAPTNALALEHMHVADLVHSAVGRLAGMETDRGIHRTKLAVLMGLAAGRLVADGREVSDGVPGFYYFDPRLLVRALMFMRSDRIDVGITDLAPNRAFLSFVDRRPDYIVHCALLSIAMNTQWLLGTPAPAGARRD